MQSDTLSQMMSTQQREAHMVTERFHPRMGRCHNLPKCTFQRATIGRMG